MPDETPADPKILEILRGWLEQLPELLIMVRYRSGAGSRDFELHRSLPILQERLARLPAGASVTVFKDPRLPHRGVVTDTFIDRVLSTIADGYEYLILEDAPVSEDPFSWCSYRIGESHAELREHLEESRGARVAVGYHPPWLNMGDQIVHAYIPDEDGIVRPGAY